MVMVLPASGPGFLVEAKIVRGAQLICTAMQMSYLDRFNQPPGFFAAIVGWSASRGALYIGHPLTRLADCRYVPRPNNLASSDWLIAELLQKFVYDETRVDVVRSTTYIQPTTTDGKDDTDAP
jgi:hypothetical protein